MTTAVSVQSAYSRVKQCLMEAVEGADFHQQPDGSWTATADTDEGMNCVIQLAIDGWLKLERPWNEQTTEAAAILAQHSDWCGPVKLEQCGERIVQRLDLWMGPFTAPGHRSILDGPDVDMLRELLTGVFQRGPDYFSGAVGISNGNSRGQTHFSVTTSSTKHVNTRRKMSQIPACERLPDWQPPSAEFLTDCLTDAGQTSTIDPSGNIRLTVKRPSCDGQIRIERSPGRLRYVMPLGKWSRLNPVCRKSIMRLACQANDCARLVRIAWCEEDKGESCQCEAQVDLSGLPIADPADSVQTAFWRALTGAAVDGLALCLRRLGLELSQLARNDSTDLARIVLGEADFEESC